MKNIYFRLIEIYFEILIRYIRMIVGLLVYFIYYEFMIDCLSLQQRDNIAYESIFYSIFIFFVCYNDEIM